MGMVSFAVAEMGCDDRDYDSWLATLFQASERLETLEAAFTELCQQCRRGDIRSERVLEILERHGAMSKAAHARTVAA